MSFRAKLRVFFGLIVVLPMIALAFVLFEVTERSETGKVDAGVASGARTALGLYQASAEEAAPALRRVAADDRLRSALVAGRGVEERMAELVRGSPGIEAIELRADGGEVVARAGSAAGVAPRGAPLSIDGRSFGVLAVSQTDAEDLLARTAGLTGLELALYRDDRLVAATATGFAARPQEVPRGAPRDLRLDGADYRGRLERFIEAAGAPVELAVAQDRTALDDRIARSRLVIGGLLLAFVLLALVSAGRVGRALAGQIATFLAAARRLGRGDFAQPVPVTGRDEFAELGREFNRMSSRLETTIQEIERQRAELEAAIRGIGDALATGPDRQRSIELIVRAAVDACHADGGRAVPIGHDAFQRFTAGAEDGRIAEALAAAERRALETPRDDGRRVVGAETAGVHALAFGMRTATGASDDPYLGAIAIARRDRPFSPGQEDLLEYLAGQAMVSIENASLHETVERQAVTDELTGLANARAFHTILAREIERARRFRTPLALMMVDLDDFKQVNDTYGHQQGDAVLASVAAMLREFSRDIDAPARYGGEELAVILPQTDVAGAALLAERAREAIEAEEIRMVDAPGSLRVTASFGVAALPESASDKGELVAAADGALYRAKRAGKNRVERADPVAAAESA